MLKSYITTAFRNLTRQKGYSFINLLGLAIGIACCLVILLYIRDEFSHDRWSEDWDRIYRVTADYSTPDRGDIRSARTPPPWAPSLAEEYPEVDGYVRIKTPLVSWLVSHEEGNLRFHEKGFYFADAGVFEIFGLDLIEGDPASALTEPRTLVMTESAARRYFDDKNPVGRTLRLDNQYDFLVTGIMKDVPRRSHFDFDILASFSTLSAVPIYGGVEYPTWRNGIGPDLYTYLRLRPEADADALEAKLPQFIDKFLGNILPRINIEIRPALQPLSEIHLRSHLDFEMRANSDIRYIYIFSAVALFVLLIACVNFMNLATARSFHRAREVGMRKVIGAERRQLLLQFLGESMLMAVLALILALALALVLLPAFNALAGKQLRLGQTDPWALAGTLGITLLVGLLSGIYPAFFLSSFQPVTVFRGALRAGRAGARLRQVLVVFQFALSIVFLIGTGVVYHQLLFIRAKTLGFAKEQVVVLPMGDPRARQIYLSFRDRAVQHPAVQAVAGASSVPGGLFGPAIFRPEGAAQGDEVTMDALFVDHDFAEAMGLEMAAGRDFSTEFATDTREAFILNQTGARYLGWENDALGKEILIPGFKRGRVVGVVRDFHLKSLHQKIEPLLLQIAPDPDAYLQLVVRVPMGDVDAALGAIQAAWREVYPQDPFAYSFLDDDFDRLYSAEDQRGRVFLAFSGLAVFIACLGLLGLASFLAEQRRKEIGIRKVLGASTSGVARLLSLEFVRLVGVANLIAWPAAWLIMDRWLQNFAYRAGQPLALFPAAGALAVIIALVTISGQALRAARVDPAVSLRTE